MYTIHPSKPFHMPSYRDTSYTSGYSSTLPRSYGSSSIRSPKYSTGSLYGGESSRVYNKPPISGTAVRPLPKGPGPLDKYGNRQDYSAVRNALRHRSTSSTSNVTRPVRGDHYAGGYTSSTYTPKTTYSSGRESPLSSERARLRRETLSPPGAGQRKRTSSIQDLSDSYRNLDLNDVGTTSGLHRGRQYGSLSNISSSSRRSSIDSGETNAYGDKLYSSRYRNRNYNSSNESSLQKERDDSPKGRITANLTPEKVSPVYSRIRSKDLYNESDEDTASPSYTTPSPQDANNNNRLTSDYKNSGKTGLSNLGNTCFMNCILQCLSNTRPLLEFCLGDKYKAQINKKTSSMKGTLVTAYASLMKDMWEMSRSSVSPKDFKSQIQRFAPRFTGYNQQDCQEFLRYLLQGLHEDINRVQSKPKPPPVNEEEENALSDDEKGNCQWTRYMCFDSSVIVDLFVGQLKSTLKCTTCFHESVTFDPFWDLSLPIPKRSSGTDINDCFSLFMQEEVLDGDERPKCEKCKVHRKCTKSFRIQKFPRILVLHLKRFSGDRFRSKLSTTVNYPLIGLDLSGYASSSAGSSKSLYNLYGVSNHSGSVYSGHYTAYCKHPYSGHWMSCNDSHVRDTTSKGIISSEGYVLFYERAGDSQL